jgi:hypothetical protein
MATNYCAACRSKQVEVPGGICEQCAINRAAPGDFAYHEIDGYSLVRKTLSVLNAAVERLRDEGMTYTEMELGERQAVMRRMADLGRSVGMVAKEARAYEVHVAKTAKNMSKEEKAALIREAFSMMPVELKKKLLQQLIGDFNDSAGSKVLSKKA